MGQHGASHAGCAQWEAVGILGADLVSIYPLVICYIGKWWFNGI